MAEERLQITVDEKGALVVKRKLEGVGEGARKAGSGVKLLRTALGGLATVGIGAVFTKAVKTMASFSQEMSTVKAITGETGIAFDDLKNKARELGATTRFSATEAAQGMTFLARAGFSAEQVLSSIGPTLQLAQAGALSLGRAADIASNVLTGFRISADDAVRVVDVLALAANSANTNVEQLGEAMSYLAPIASSLGVSLEETAAGVQTLSDAGIQASRAGTNLTMVMRLMESPTKKQLGVLEKLGLTQDDVRVSQVGLTQAMTNLREAGAQTGDIFKFFGRSAAAASVIMEGTTGKMQRFTAANEKAKGTAAGVAEIMDDNLNGALLAVRSAWEELQLAFGEQGTQNALTQGLKNLATVLRFLAANIDIVVNSLVALSVSMAALKWGAFLQGVTTAAGGMGLLKGGITGVKTAMAGLALNPVTAGFIALSAAIAATNIVFNKFNELQAEIEAIEERTYKMRLKRLQAQVKEIQERKAANAALEGYITSLERENEFMKMTEEAQQESINLNKALEIAKRALTDTEKERITALLQERQAIEEANKRRQEEQELLQNIRQPAADYAHQLELLNALKAQGVLVGTEYKDTLAALKEEYGQGAEGGGGAGDYIARMERELDLLKMTNAEREVQRAIDQAQTGGVTLQEGEAERIRELVTARQQLTATQDAENQALADQAMLLEQIKGPKEEQIRMEAALQTLLDQKLITAEEYKEKLLELDAAMQDSVAATTSVMDDVWGSVWENASSALNDFVETGKVDFRSLANDIIKSIQKIIAKQMIMLAFKAMGIPIPAFQHGGSFTVGGQPGIDQNLVAFRATRGEQVDITPAGQQAAGGQPTVVQSAAPQIRIVNVTDPEEITKAMNSVEGEQVVINIISRNGDTIKQALA